jgi:hypothetical protein
MNADILLVHRKQIERAVVIVIEQRHVPAAIAHA